MCNGDWIINLQANEVLHESSLPVLKNIMRQHLENPAIEALLLRRLEFWGDYNHVGAVYPHRFKYTPRILRPHIGTYSIRDAMSVAIFDNFSRKGRYPRAADTGQQLFRYGNVRSHDIFADKQEHAVHHADANRERPLGRGDLYNSLPRSFVAPYKGSHPSVMLARITHFTDKISLADPRWRLSLTLNERRRLVETWFYQRFQIPRWRNKRYNLVGGYLPDTDD
jgi:hypothetical protein